MSCACACSKVLEPNTVPQPLHGSTRATLTRDTVLPYEVVLRICGCVVHYHTVHYHAVHKTFHGHNNPVRTRFQYYVMLYFVVSSKAAFSTHSYRTFLIYCTLPTVPCLLHLVYCALSTLTSDLWLTTPSESSYCSANS